MLLASVPGCDQGAIEDPQGAPQVMQKPRRFMAPGAIGQGLDKGARSLVFLELHDGNGAGHDGVDPDWRFEMKVRGPDGSWVALETDPFVPRAWKSDDGVRLIGAFTAPSRGTYQIEITSEDCPRMTVPMIVLPIF